MKHRCALAMLLLLTACGPDERFDVGFRVADGGSDARVDSGAPVTLPPLRFGLDAYRRWDELPYLRIGMRTTMLSTYDRTGGNEGADASHFLREDAPNRFVALDVAGPGVLSFVRANHWHGSPWRYEVDGVAHEVSESSTADPTHPIAGSTFLPEAAFPRPLALTWSTTQGADLSWVPIAFRQGLELDYGRTHYGTGYFILQRFAQGSGPRTAWNEQPPTSDVLNLLANAGNDIAPTGAAVRVSTDQFDVSSGGSVVFARLADGPAVVRALTIRVSRDQALALEHARLSVTWDGRASPSIDAPVALFFGTGSLFNRSNAEWLVKGLLFHVRFTANDVELATYFPMPYFEQARFELKAAGVALTNVRTEVRSVAFSGARDQVGYFHATYRDHGVPQPGKDLVFLDTRNAEGGGDWCGSFVGTSFIFSDRASHTTVEGDPRFFFDDSQSPSAQGTGSEEWGGGGDYWGGKTVTLPLAGHPVGASSPGAALNAEDEIESEYRVLIADAFAFGTNARIQFEHGGLDDSTEHYRSVTYWYGAPGACLVETDSLNVGDPQSEAAHAYSSPEAGPPRTVTSRWDWGVDHVGSVEVQPETADTGRTTRGTSEFTLAIDPANLGVLLRRKLDYAVPNQCAKVYVAGTEPGAPFKYAGTWYTAGSNSVVYSNPPGELDPPSPVIETSNRRWRDSEFLLPPALTENRSAIRLRFVDVPRDLPLLPGAVATPSGWSAFRYWAYCYQLPSAGH